jgi:Fe2+ transport system protein FeoA
VAFASAFAFGLVTGHALEKVSSLPLNATWRRRARDMAVAAGERLARAVALRRTP